MSLNENTTFTSFLSKSDNFIETLTITKIEAQPDMVELTIKTQFLSAKKPDELQVKFRACIAQSRLEELEESIGRFLVKTRK